MAGKKWDSKSLRLVHRPKGTVDGWGSWLVGDSGTVGLRRTAKMTSVQQSYRDHDNHITKSITKLAIV